MSGQIVGVPNSPTVSDRNPAVGRLHKQPCGQKINQSRRGNRVKDKADLFPIDGETTCHKHENQLEAAVVLDKNERTASPIAERGGQGPPSEECQPVIRGTMLECAPETTSCYNAYDHWRAGDIQNVPAGAEEA